MKRKLCFGLLLVMICTCVFTGCNTMDTPISSGTPTSDTQSTGTSSPASSTVGSVSESTSSQTSSVTSAAGKTSTTSQTQKPTVSTRATTTTSKPTTTTSAPVVLGKSENNVEFIGRFATVGGTDYKKFEWSGSTITAGFEGTEISIVLKILRNGPYGENDYLNVTVDNEPVGYRQRH